MYFIEVVYDVLNVGCGTVWFLIYSWTHSNLIKYLLQNREKTKRPFKSIKKPIITIHRYSHNVARLPCNYCMTTLLRVQLLKVDFRVMNTKSSQHFFTG